MNQSTDDHLATAVEQAMARREKASPTARAVRAFILLVLLAIFVLICGPSIASYVGDRLPTMGAHP